MTHAPDDLVAEFLDCVGRGRLDAVRALVAADPALVRRCCRPTTHASRSG